MDKIDRHTDSRCRVTEEGLAYPLESQLTKCDPLSQEAPISLFVLSYLRKNVKGGGGVGKSIKFNAYKV